ncbi:hypothetical protein EDB86DRAFT_1794718 [Lactarius hatsudake]|nr:hypothetical protein EDB86DRAFT_1794718 [Lactarius hatsudake]
MTTELLLAPMVRSGTLRCKACMGSRDCRFSYSNIGRVMGRWLCRAKPDLAVQAARRVVDDVFGVEFNCGRSKPVSTHSGMGPPTERPQTSVTFVITTFTTHLRLRGLEDAPAPDATRHPRPHGAHRQQGQPHDPLTYAQCASARPCTRSSPQEVVDFVEGLGRDVTVVEDDDFVSFEDAQ